MFLSAGFGRSNRRWMTDLTVDSQLLHQVQKPFHRSGCFDTYTYRTGKRSAKRGADMDGGMTRGNQSYTRNAITRGRNWLLRVQRSRRLERWQCPESESGLGRLPVPSRTHVSPGDSSTEFPCARRIFRNPRSRARAYSLP